MVDGAKAKDGLETHETEEEEEEVSPDDGDWTSRINASDIDFDSGLNSAFINEAAKINEHQTGLK